MTPEQLTFPTTDGTRLAATLELPDGPGPHPAALLIVGSGPVDRDSNLPRLPLAVTRELAHALRDAGVASLRYDKRGVGASEGSFLETTFELARRDAGEALAALRRHPGVDPSRLLVVGHSEGALHAASLAAADASLTGLVLLSGPAVPGEAVLRWQTASILPTLPAPVRGLLRVLGTLPERLQARAFARVRASDQAVLRVQGQKLNAGWLRGFLDHDPATEFASLEVPVLAITGERDLQVDPDDLERLRTLIANAPLEVHRIPQVNHVLRHTDGVGAPGEYRRQAKAGQALDPRVLSALSTWAGDRLHAAV